MDEQDKWQVTVTEDGYVNLLPTDRVAVAVVDMVDNEPVGKVVQARVASVEGDMVFVTFKGHTDVKMYDRSAIHPLYRSCPLGVIPLAVSSKIR